MILNGGNYGGVDVQIRNGTKLIAVNTKDTNDYWLYSTDLNFSYNADFIGCCTVGDPRLTDKATQVEVI